MGFFYSVLGVYDGNVYEALWDKVQHEPLNQTEVPRGYEVHILHLIIYIFTYLILSLYHLGIYQADA